MFDKWNHKHASYKTLSITTTSNFSNFPTSNYSYLSDILDEFIQYIIHFVLKNRRSTKNAWIIVLRYNYLYNEYKYMLKTKIAQSNLIHYTTFGISENTNLNIY